MSGRSLYGDFTHNLIITNDEVVHPFKCFGHILVQKLGLMSTSSKEICYSSLTDYLINMEYYLQMLLQDRIINQNDHYIHRILLFL